MPTTRLVFGCGYLGLRTARLWQAAGDATIAATRRAAPSPEMAAAGLHAFQADVADPATLRTLADVRTPAGAAPESLLYAVGYDRTGGPDIHAVYADGLQNVLAALPRSVSRVIYISTTGVYGPHSGEWVDESTPPDPQRDGGRASLAAEQRLAAHPLAARSAILRLAGIYGPDRVPHLDKLRTGQPLPVAHDGWLNLIHVDDAARIVVAADAWLAERAEADGPHLFCVSDGAPVRRGDFYAEVARLLGTPPPQFVAPPADSPAAARAGASRRVRNDKLRQTLPVALEHPNYRAGLAAILG
ncbi:MAG TPA: NAD-dependent epimerase/dehydratase family protein [Lacipirellulaceae bacterium]|nr:NAD-dependent epimerase/dehydratase family protein [Lacipirellulaceae bacterium]